MRTHLDINDSNSQESTSNFIGSIDFHLNGNEVGGYKVFSLKEEKASPKTTSCQRIREAFKGGQKERN